jgi:hypothetical protein
MKHITLIAALLLTGCSFIMPIQHDPVMYGHLIDVKVATSKISCEKKEVWKPVLDKLEILKAYTESREDPQAKNMDQLYIAMEKASTGSTAYCEATLKLNKTRIQVLENAWKGRTR